MSHGLRAVSPVVAVTLLIIVAVVTAVVLYMWTSGIVQQQPTQQAKLQEAIKIEAVNLTNKKIYNVFVRNIGDTSVNITTLYIIDAVTGDTIHEESPVYIANATNPSDVIKPDTLLKPGEVWNITVNANPDTDTVNGVDVSSYKAVIVKVVTKDGVEATYLVEVK